MTYRHTPARHGQNRILARQPPMAASIRNDQRSSATLHRGHRHKYGDARYIRMSGIAYRNPQKGTGPEQRSKSSCPVLRLAVNPAKTAAGRRQDASHPTPDRASQRPLPCSRRHHFPSSAVGTVARLKTPAKQDTPPPRPHRRRRTRLPANTMQNPTGQPQPTEKGPEHHARDSAQ